MTERPIEDQSDLIKELYSDLTVVKPREGLFLNNAFTQMKLKRS